jgi:hypothetical protein
VQAAQLVALTVQPTQELSQGMQVDPDVYVVLGQELTQVVVLVSFL